MDKDDLKAYRKMKMVLTQVELARMLKVSRRTLQTWEAGQVRVPYWVPIVLKSLRK